jgi:hypothetical protein
MELRKGFRAVGALCVLVVLGAGLGAASGADPAPTCGQYDAVSLQDGLYMFEQNEWNSGAVQCAVVTQNGFRLTKANFGKPTNGAPATFPFIMRGCHWGGCTQESHLPLRVSKLRSARSTWVTVQPKAGAYDVAYDIWTNSAPTTGGQPDGSEVMIWLASRGGVQPFGKKIGTTRIAGARWEVWSGRQPSWNVISYRRVPTTLALRNVDVKPFIDDSVRRKLTKPSWYLIDAEAGFEIWRGGKGLATTRFSFDPR